MVSKIHAVTIHSVDYKDSDRILTLFSLERGKISVSCRGVRKANAKLKNLAEPFCFAEVVISEKSGRLTATECDVVNGFYPIRADIERFYAGMTVLEFTSAFMPEGLEASDYFSLLIECLYDIAYGEMPIFDRLANFFIKALGLNGYSVNTEGCGRCEGEILGRVFFSHLDGNVCESCRKDGDKEYSFQTYSYLGQIAGGDYNGDRDRAKNCLRFLSYYMSITANVNLKSLHPLLEL